MSLFNLKRSRSAENGAKSGTSCLLIDYENLAISLKENRSTESLDLSLILDVARDRTENGRLDVIYAYADWRHFSQHANTLVRLGVKTVQAPSFRYQGKNATDIQMAVEATDLLHLHPEMQTYFLATGDSDFTPLVQLLRSRGKQVIGIGIGGSVSRQLTTVCDDFILYEDLVAESEKPGIGNEKIVEPARRPTSSSQSGREAAKPMPRTSTPIVSKTSRPAIKSVSTPAANGYSKTPVKANGNNNGLAELREAIGLDPAELLTSERLKQLLPLAAEAWHEVKPDYAPQMRRALMKRFPDKVNSFEAQVASSLLEKTGGLGVSGWLPIGDSDGDLLFDMLLHTSQQTLNQQGRSEADDPQRLGEVMLQDSIARPELRMRIVRGRSAIQKFQQVN
jgi:uncharacterized LabA/DUF88 family protein